MEGYEGVLPRFLREALVWEKGPVEELRLREGQPLAASAAGREWTHPAWKGRVLTEEDLRRCCGNVLRQILDSQIQREYR